MRRTPLLLLAAFAVFLRPGAASAAPRAADSASRPPFRAGLASVTITPREPVWMAGYAARTRPSEGSAMELRARALALEDGRGARAVLLTADILGFPADVSGRIAREVRRRHGIRPERLVLNASHTHGGPAIGENLRIAYQGITAEQEAAIRRYTAELEGRLVDLVGAALKDLRPARLRFGRGEAGFAANRRLSLNPNGPVDHEVPVLRVDGPDGALRGVVFGYACHCTTLGGNNYLFHGDYAGVAQERLERSRAGATALFVTGCGADINPAPRGTPELAQRHGEALASAVEAVLERPLAEIGGPLRCARDVVPLRFGPLPDRAGWEAKLQDRDRYVRAHARRMLDLLEREGRLPESYPCPVQVWRFGQDLTFIPMAGEVVVDYALRLKRELGPERTWVAGYSNDVFAYVPSLRVLKEGGYEGAGAMIYYGLPGAFAEDVEERLIRAVHTLVRRTQ